MEIETSFSVSTEALPAPSQSSSRTTCCDSVDSCRLTSRLPFRAEAFQLMCFIGSVRR